MQDRDMPTWMFHFFNLVSSLRTKVRIDIIFSIYHEAIAHAPEEYSVI